MRRIVARCIFPGIYVGFHDLSLVEGRADETEEMGLQRTFSTSFPFAFCLKEESLAFTAGRYATAANLC